MKVIAALRPNVFVEEAAQAPLWRNCEDIFTLLGTEVVYDDQSRLDSTTAIIDRVLAGAAVPVEA